MKKTTKVVISVLLSLLLVLAPMSGATSVLAELVVKAHAADYSSLTTALNNYVNNAGYNNISVTGSASTGYTITDSSSGGWAYKVAVALAPVVSTLTSIGGGGSISGSGESSTSISSTSGNFLGDIYNAVISGTGATGNAAALIGYLIPLPDGYQYNSSNPYTRGVNTGDAQQWELNNVDAYDASYADYGDITCTVTRTLYAAFTDYSSYSSLPSALDTTFYITYHTSHWTDDYEWTYSYNEGDWSSWFTMYARKAVRYEYYYFNAAPSYGVSAQSGSSEISRIKAFGSRFGTASANNARLSYDLYSSAYFNSSWLSAEISANDSVYNDLVNNVSSSYYNLYFTQSFVNTTVHDTYMYNCLAAQLVLNYKDTVSALNSVKAVGAAVDSSTYSSQKANYNNAVTWYNTLTCVFDGSTTPRVRALAKLQSSFSLEQWSVYSAYITELKKNLDLYDLRDYKAKITAVEGIIDGARLVVSDEQAHKIAGSASDTITSEMLGVYRDELNGWYSAVYTYDTSLITEVFTDESPALSLSLVKSYYVSDITFELNVRAYEPVYSGYVSWFEPRIAADVSSDTDAQIMTLITEAETQQTNYLNSYNACVSATSAQAAATIFGTYSQNIQTYIDSLYTLLAARMTSAIDTAYSWYTDYNSTVTYVNFTMLKDYINDLSGKSATYSFLTGSSKSGTAYFHSAAADYSTYVNEYNTLLNTILASYNSFKASAAFSGYSEIYLDNNTGTYYTRKATDEDLARDVGDSADDYTVTTANIGTTITKLDDFLTGSDFSTIVNLSDMGSTLPEVIETLLNEQVYTDKMINTIVAALFPMLTEQLQTQLTNAINSMSPYKLSGGNSAFGYSGSFTLYINGANGSKSLQSVFEEYGLYLYPSSFAKMCTAYSSIYSSLISMGTTWNEGAISSFDWGIDSASSDQKEAKFEAALTCMINAILPVAQAAFCGYQGYSKEVDNVATAEDKSFEVQTLWTNTFDVKGTANVTLRINSSSDGGTALYGYDDILGPIFEALGITDYNTSYSLPTLSGACSASTIVSAVVGPIEELISQLEYHPLDKILSVLPNLAHAVSFDLFQPLFENLPVVIGYTLGLDINNFGNISSSIANTLAGWFADMDDLYDGKLSLNLGDYIDLQSMLGISDITDLNSVLSYILLKTGVTDPDGDGTANFSLPYINAGELSVLGSLGTSSSIRTKSMNGLSAGTRYTITADKADVFWFLLQYLSQTAGNTAFLESAVSALGGSLDISDSTAAALAGLAEDPGAAAAAIIEIFNQQTYGFREYSWQTTDNQAASGVTAASGVYLNYNTSNQWTRAKASYVYDNINDILDSALSGQDSESISDLISDKIQSIYRRETIAQIAEALGSISTKISLDDTLLDLIKSQLGIDLTAWSDYTGENVESWLTACAYDENDASTDTAWQTLPEGNILRFAEGDETGFVNALTTLLTPASAILEFLLSGEDLSMLNGRTIYTGSSKIISINGYDGYTYGIVPLFEALGISDIKTQAEYDALSSSESISYLLNSVFGRLDEIAEDPIHELCEALPSLLYFVYSDGLYTGLINTLHSLCCLVDTLRPIYDLDLTGIIRDALADLTVKDLSGNDVSISFPQGMTLEDFLSVDNILSIAEQFTGLKLNPLLNEAIQGLFISNVTTYTVGSFTGCTMAYDTDFQPYDMFTVIIELAVELINYGSGNLTILADLLNVNPNLIVTVYDIIGGGDIEDVQINWCYFDSSSYEPLDFVTALDTQNNDSTKRSIYKVENLYLTDWTQESSEYLQANFTSIVDSLLSAFTADSGTPITSLSALLTSLPDELYTNATLTKLASALSHYLDGYTDADGKTHSGLSSQLLDALNVVFDMGGLTETVTENGTQKNVSIFYKYTMSADLDEDGVYDFGVTAGDPTAFADELGKLLSPLNSVLRWMLLGQTADFLYGSEEGGIASEDGGDLIVVPGFDGYDKGLIPLMEALGIDSGDIISSEDLLAASAADSTAIVDAVIKPLLSRISAILEDPDELLDMLPELIYFVNCGGFSASISNTIAALDNIFDKVNAHIDETDDNYPITEIDLTSLTGGFDITDITFDNLLSLAEDKTGLNLSSPIGDLLKTFSIGEIVCYTSANGEPALRMQYRTDAGEYASDRGDMMTIICCMLLSVLRYSDDSVNNADALAFLIGGDDTAKVAKLRDTFSQIVAIMADEGDITLDGNNWLYMLNGLAETFSDGDTVATTAQTTLNYLKYANNWTDSSAEYLVRNLDSLVTSILTASGASTTSVTELVNNSIDGFCNDETVYELAQKLADIIPAKLKGVDTLLGADGLLYKTLDIDLSAYDTIAAKYKAAVDSGTPIVTDLTSFGSALTELLTPLNGLLRWMLLGDDITLFNDDNYPATDAYITISGADGYSQGLVPLLEALGCTGLASSDELKALSAEDDSALAEAIITPLMERLTYLTTDTTLDDGTVVHCLDKVLSALPELIYFMNADGIKNSVNNTIAALTNLLDEINPLLDEDKRIDLDTLLSSVIPGVDLTDLTTSSLLDLLYNKTGISLPEDLRDYVTQYYLGTLTAYTSANGSICFRTVYDNSVEQRMDLITSVVGVVVETFRYEGNEEALTKLLPAGVYEAVMNVLNANVVDLLPVNWLNTSAADTGETFSPLSGDSEYWPNGGYGAYWTREKAEYVAANFGSGVDNIITLLGVEDQTTEQINAAANSGTTTEVYYNSLKQVLESLVGGNVYTEANAEKILAAIKTAVAKVNALPAAEYIKGEVLRCIGVDLDAWDDMSTFGITDGNRTQFVNALVTILRPLEPVLAWMLRGDRDISFFYDSQGSDAVTLVSCEGYAYGIIPVLEALGCDSSSILTPAQYNSSADKNADNMILNIIDPLLDRVDEILADPGNEILQMLPEVIYFINSDGLDVCFRNLLRSVYSILSDIEPVTKVDLYDTLGFHLDTDPQTGDKIDFNYIIDWALAKAKDKTGFDFDGMNLGDTLAQLAVGKLESFTSKNSDTAYRMIYVQDDTSDTTNEAAMVTLVAAAAVKFIVTGENAAKLKALVDEKVSSTTAPYIDSLIDTLVKYAGEDGNLEDNNLDLMLGTFYYLFYGANTASKASNQFLSDFNSDWSFVYQCMSTSDSAEIKEAADQLYSLMDQISGGVFDMDGLASKGLIPFFQKIVEIFQKIIAFFQNLFK